MSEQPKPLSAEEESLLRTGAGLFALKESIEREKRGPWCDVVRLFATLDAERKRADAAERDLNTAREVNKATLRLAESGERAAVDRIAAAMRRADVAERRVQKLMRAMEYVIERASEITSDHHRDDCPVEDGCESCRLGDIVNDAMSDGGIVAAEKSCEDWQECASRLALALKASVPIEHRTPDENEALAEFDRLASEATKGETP